MTYRESIFHPFHRGKMTDNNVIHISNFYFRFFKDNEEMKLNTREQEVHNEDCYVNSSETFLRGPF